MGSTDKARFENFVSEGDADHGFYMTDVTYISGPGLNVRNHTR